MLNTTKYKYKKCQVIMRTPFLFLLKENERIKNEDCVGKVFRAQKSLVELEIHRK